MFAVAQIDNLGHELQRKTNECANLAGKSESLEQEYRVNVSAMTADISKIDMKIISARKSKPKLKSLLAIYDAHKAVESARKEVHKIQEDIKLRGQALATIKEMLLRLRKQQQTVKKQACAQAITET